MSHGGPPPWPMQPNSKPRLEAVIAALFEKALLLNSAPMDWRLPDPNLWKSAVKGQEVSRINREASQMLKCYTSDLSGKDES